MVEYSNKVITYIVEDNELYAASTINGLKSSLSIEYQITHFPTGEALINFLDEGNPAPEFLILDFYLNSIDKTAANGKEILKQVKERFPQVKVIVLSSQEDIQNAVDLLKHGAFDYIIKNEDAVHMVDKSIKHMLEVNEIEDNARNLVHEIETYKIRSMFASIAFFILALANIVFFIFIY